MNKTQFKKIEDLTTTNILYVRQINKNIVEIEDLTTKNILYVRQINKNIVEIKKMLASAKVTGKMTAEQQNLIIPQTQVFNEELKNLLKHVESGI